MSTQMSEEQAYQRIAVLTSQRSFLEVRRIGMVKAIRALKVLIDEGLLPGGSENPAYRSVTETIAALNVERVEMWQAITALASEIDRLTRLAQDGAFSHA